MVAHLVTCDDCREMVAMAAEAPAPVPAAQQPTRLPKISVYGALVVAASLLLAVYVMRPTAPSLPNDAGDPWRAIDAATGATRPVEGRLSLITRHAPFASPSRSAAGASTSFAADAVAARLAGAVATAPLAARPEAEHAAAVAALIARHPADAIARLDRVIADAPGSATRLSDLAAAHLALAAVGSRVHFTAALEAADQALRLAPQLHAARFNRALALEGLGRADEARDVWQALAADATDDAAWRGEAARRVQRPSR